MFVGDFMKSTLSWSLGYCDSADLRPLETFSATVPGAVQLDYAKAYNLPDYNFEKGYEEYRWMEDKFWVYSAEYDATSVNSPYLRFIAEGIDYKYDIFVNSKKLLSYEGMYRKSVVDLTEYIGQKISLEIVVYPVPKSTVGEVNPNSRDEQKQSCKPGVSYGWDFHPRLIPLGIWKDAYIELSEHKEHIKPTVNYTITENRDKANVAFNVNVDNIIGWKMFAPNGDEIFNSKTPLDTFEINNPELWWCNGYGDPNLYAWELEVSNLGVTETFKGRIGFKTVTLEMNEGTWALPEFPKSRSCPPITLCLNGVKIFGKGSNWVAPEIFYSKLNYNRYYEQLSLIKDANMNLIRSWGGAIVNKDEFFDICDELGIMVWQEFPLGCNNYIATKHYMDLLNREALDIIKKVSSHVCLAIWCGGNELFNSWSGMTDQSLPLRLLNSLTLNATPNIPFMPTSPLMGMGHGSYTFIYHDGREVIQALQESHNTAYTEFGCPAISNLDCLSLITDTKNLFPLAPNEITVAHHAFGAWSQKAWACVCDIEKYFGESESLEELVNNSQYLQGVGYRFIFEEARRQKPYCSMALNWCLNEPWPCIANNSIISYPNSVKPAYYEIKKACRSLLASARFRKLKYNAGELLDFDLFMLNDGINEVEEQIVKVSVQVGSERPVHIMDCKIPELAANTNFEGPTLRYKLPVVNDATTFKIILEAGEASSEYLLLYNPPVLNKPKIKNLNMD